MIDRFEAYYSIRREVKDIDTSERRIEIIRLLCRRRKETVKNIAMEFGVTERTIRRDIEVLCISYPIYTKRGRIDGGVSLIDSFSFERLYMTDKTQQLFEKALDLLEKNKMLCESDIEEMRSALAECREKR